MVKRSPPRAIPVLIGLAVLLLPWSCDLFGVPDDLGGGRSNPEPPRELFVLHSLSESLTTLPISEDGSVGTGESDVLRTGAIPNDLIRVGPFLVVVVSGENALRTINEDSLLLSRSIDLGLARNPMRAAAFADATSLPAARWLVATTNLLADSVSIVDIDRGLVVAELLVGAAPQAIVALPGGDQDEVRLVVSNTNFRTDRPPEIPYGPGSLTEIVLAVSLGDDGAPDVTPRSTRTVILETPEYDPDLESGINPGEILSLSAKEELLVIGAGVNLLPGGGGADDGTILVLDFHTLDILDRIPIGGSPATGTLRTGAADTTLYTAGVDGIRRLLRYDVTGWESPDHIDTTLIASSGATGSLFTDCLVDGDHLYVADFAGDRLRILHRTTAAVIQEVSLSDGPIALLWDDES